MRGFFTWLDEDAPVWAICAVITLFIAAVFTWLISAAHFESLFIFFSPLAVAAYAVWTEYKHSKGDDQ